jgi:hypothetical protein
MNACLFVHCLFLGIVLAPVTSKGQSGFSRPAAYSEEKPGITANVPLNEINIRAYRHFHRQFPTVVEERWFKYEEGYQVSFTLDGQSCQAHFDKRGAFLYSLKYYAGKDLTRDVSESIKRKFPNDRIGVVTEITDGTKTFYLVKIVNPLAVKTLSICDGKIDVIEELINGG